MAITIKNLHSQLPEDQLHEAKGFTTASNNTYLKKNQDGSSEWLAEYWLEPVLGVVTGASAPPTESTGHRYILTGSSFNAGWDSPAQHEIVEFDGTSWVGIAAVDGMRVVDLSDDSVYYFNTAWNQVTDANTNTTYTISAVDSGDDAIIRLTAGGSGSGDDDVTLVAGTNITITPSGDNITIAASGGGTYTAGDGLDVTANEFSIDAKANGGLVIESTELAVDLGASAITGTLAIGDGGTGQTTAQAAIDALTNVSGATDEHVLTKDTSTGNAIWKAAAGGGGGASALGDLSDCTTPATDNYGIGTDAIDSITTGDYNIGIGLNAGKAITTSTMNVCIGRGAGAKISTGSGRNVCIGGYDAGGEITTEIQNVCIGYEAGSALTSSNNVAIGYAAGKANSTAGCNTFVGMSAGSGATGQQNVAIGYLAANSASFSGSYNVVMGRSEDLTTGAGNTILGVSYSISNITTGSYNTIVGHQALGSPTANNQIAIGYQAASDGANTIQLGNSSISTADIQVSWTVASDERVKDNITDAAIGLDFINALRPVTFTKIHPADYPTEIRENRYKKGGVDYDEETEAPIKDEFDTTTVHDGLIAQEVKAAMNSLGVDFSGWKEKADGRQGLQYEALVMPLIKAVQELSAKVTALENS